MANQYKPLRTFTVFHALGYCTIQAYTLKGAALRFLQIKGFQADSILPGKLSF